jgi:hypothetical protein
MIVRTAPRPNNSTPPTLATSAAGSERTLAAYDAGGHPRLVCVEDAADGSLLVVDRRSRDLTDARLVARIAPDEPPLNARIVCDHYLVHPRACRPLTDADLGAHAVAGDVADLDRLDIEAPLEGRDGVRFQLAVCAGDPPELRWVRDRGERPVSIRSVVGTVEDYEPARTLSLAAVARHRRTPGVTITTLGTELRRLGGSRIVLNRLLRETVLETIRAHGLSMSAIALRCGRVKRDGRGNVSGETSWLARRIGLLPAGGDAAPTPWIHSDVLALIARRGLGIDPREVELG